MKTIGEFAKENNVTVKALHHYEKLGLLLPAKKDVQTNYRYYHDIQQHDLEMILLLKDLGLSLSEIKDIVLGNDITQFEELLLSKQHQTQIDISSASVRFNKITAILKILQSKAHSNLNYKELINMSESSVQKLYGNAMFKDLAQDMVDKAQRLNRSVTAIQMDIDEFMSVNKNFGRDIGDIVIDRIGNAILSTITSSPINTIFERRGGDEYTVIAEAPLLDGVVLANHILESVNNIDYLDVSESLKPTITIGLSELNDETKGVTYLIHDATTTLYEAKRQGNKNSVNY